MPNPNRSENRPESETNQSILRLKNYVRKYKPRIESLAEIYSN